MTSTQKVQYNKGKLAAKRKLPASFCPLNEDFAVLKAFWLAGWHDWHIENGSTIKA